MSNKFSDVFSAPVSMSDGTYAITGEINIEEAAKRLSVEIGEDIQLSQLRAGRVRFGFAPEYVEDMNGESCWYTGAREGKGSKPVWLYEK